MIVQVSQILAQYAKLNSDKVPMVNAAWYMKGWQGWQGWQDWQKACNPEQRIWLTCFPTRFMRSVVTLQGPFGFQVFLLCVCVSRWTWTSQTCVYENLHASYTYVFVPVSFLPNPIWMDSPMSSVQNPSLIPLNHGWFTVIPLLNYYNPQNIG